LDSALNVSDAYLSHGDESDGDHLHDECGIFGIYDEKRDVGRLTYFALQALQHRGQESAGIAVGDGDTVMVNKDLGLVTQVFKESDFAALVGKVAVGHVRYSTAGCVDSWEAAQPHLSAIGDEIIALAHNGTLVNTDRLRVELVERGISFRSATDSEVAAKLIGYFTQKSHHMRQGIRQTMELLDGAYAMALITSTALYAFRDPNGIRPLVIGRFPEGTYAVASETCALDIVGATYVRDVRPGEVIRINEEGLVCEQAVPPRRYTPCIFEHVYFARPDSIFEGTTIYQSRIWMGRTLAREASCDADVVIGVPDSGIPGAIGYARESGIPYAEGIVKNRYVGRTFIQPTQELRNMGIKLKLNPMRASIEGRRVVAIDDSIVRGNTSRQLVQMLREAGATEVHLRIVSPEVKWPCFYGIDTATQDQLISANKDVEGVRAFIGADSLAFLSLPGLISSIGMQDTLEELSGPGTSEHPVLHTCKRADCADADFCTACFNGVYAVEIPRKFSAHSFLAGVQPPINGDDAGTQLTIADIQE
jgi:amidophosphoribosyltransferase